MVESRPIPRRSLLKLPRQARSRQTVNDVLDAAERILQEEGAAALTTSHLVQVAGISPGSLYQYFANGDLVLAGVLERRAMEVVASARRAAGTSATPTLRSLLDALLGALEAHTSIIREILGSARLMGRSGIVRVLEGLLADLVAELPPTPPAGGRLRGEEHRFVRTNAAVFAALRWAAARPSQVSRAALLEALLRVAGETELDLACRRG